MKKIKIYKNIVFILIFAICIQLSWVNTYANAKFPAIIKEQVVMNRHDFKLEYYFPDYIYLSMDDLHDRFFAELYNYVINIDKNKNSHYLSTLGIHSVEDALKITKLWDGTKIGLTIVGYAYSQFYLHKDKGGDFDGQRNKKSFVGYCINNNIFVDFLYFAKEYFYHFRLDEGYTGSKELGRDPNGSDYFASPMASVIDTAKMFSYNKKSLPSYFYETGHVPYLYDHVPGLLKEKIKNDLYKVIKSDEYSLPDNFECFGFKFAGWYEDEEYKSGPIKKITTSYEAGSYNRIKLYGKFSRTRDYKQNIIVSTPSDIN